ncbi:MAG: cation:proton antiporter [Arachidicoccus sp.]|nr:cation:proton antiporter [Arachidicoccus sp.]
MGSEQYYSGFWLSLGFLLGDIVSPPDAVSTSAILKNVKIPKSAKAILEGESLLNDSSSLIVFRFALIAVETGKFVFHQAALNFVWVIVAGIAIGLLVGFLFYLTIKLLPTDTNMDIVLILIAPYAMYISAESIHVSGVLAVVTGGLFLSSRQRKMMSMRSLSLWSAIGFSLNGLVFILIGLQMHTIAFGLGNISIGAAINYGIIITVVLIISRIIATLGSSAFTTFISRYVTTANSHPGWRLPLVFGWAGMRGVVSLAAALSISPTLKNGEPFPQRDLILFITFIVILLTLLIQGLSLPLVIRLVKLEEKEYLPADKEEKRIRKMIASKSLDYLEKNFPEELNTYPPLQNLSEQWKNETNNIDLTDMSNNCRNVYLNLINKQRDWLHDINQDYTTDENIVRRNLLLLDLEEEKLKLK